MEPTERPAKQQLPDSKQQRSTETDGDLLTCENLGILQNSVKCESVPKVADATKNWKRPSAQMPFMATILGHLADFAGPIRTFSPRLSRFRF